MAEQKLRVVAYEKLKKVNHCIELSEGSTVDDAISKVVEGQTKYGEAWIEIYENGNWAKYIDDRIWKNWSKYMPDMERSY